MKNEKKNVKSVVTKSVGKSKGRNVSAMIARKIWLKGKQKKINNQVDSQGSRGIQKADLMETLTTIDQKKARLARKEGEQRREKSASANSRKKERQELQNRRRELQRQLQPTQHPRQAVSHQTYIFSLIFAYRFKASWFKTSTQASSWWRSVKTILSSQRS